MRLFVEKTQCRMENSAEENCQIDDDEFAARAKNHYSSEFAANNVRTTMKRTKRKHPHAMYAFVS